MRKFTWHEALNYLTKYNIEHGYNRRCDSEINMVVVMTEDSFDKPYSETDRSYVFSNDNKAFYPDMISNSIFADCLDGIDCGVRLDWYVGKSEDDWHVDYCYLLEEV